MGRNVFHRAGPLRISDVRRSGNGLDVAAQTTGELYWIKISCGDASITLIDDDLDWLAATLTDLAAQKATAMRLTKLAKEALDVKEAQ